jgi:hypothetical protein
VKNAPTVLALLLLVGTATAFAVTQRLKLEPSPISQTRVAKVFSPTCECDTDVARIQFSLRRPDHLRIAIRVDGQERVIADAEFKRGPVHVAWDGRDASGAPLPDGTYFAVVHMLREQRTIDLPNPIRIDTVAPTITLVGTRASGHKLRFFYRTSEPAHALLFVNGRRAVRTYYTKRRAKFDWFRWVEGDINPPRLVLEAEDLAGNRSAPERVEPS